MIPDILLLLLGLIILIYGADTMVKGASALAARFNVPNMVIGLTIVAIGTSAPELVINVISSIKGESSLALGNVLGSNIFNIMGVIGITAIIYPIGINNNTTRIEIPFVFLSAVLVLIMFGNNYWSTPQNFVISRLDGIILLAFLVLFFIYITHLALKGASEEIAIKSYTLLHSILFIIIGLTGLILGGRFLVNSAVSIAESLGVSQRIIAITIVSVGTSLPELATSVAAARRKNVDMAVGNIVGSNLFNVFFVLGISAVINPITASWESIVDISVNIMASLLIFLFIFVGKGRRIERWEGILLVSIYTTYIIYLVLS